ncbi:glycosyltransferase, partial [bacterium]|nr:glycosyltransferase [bacterium]
NSALELATGAFVAVMDHDDELPPHALYMVAKEINDHPDADIIYSDEDKIDENGKRYDPYFKSDYNPDLLHGQNMFNHLSVFRRSLLTDLGGFRIGFEGSQDYDLALRAVEATPPERIRHIPFVLYHWRVFSPSSAFSTTTLDKATDAARRALSEHFARRNLAVTVEPAPATDRFIRVRHPLPSPPPKVSLIIPTRDRVELLRGCVDGVLHRTDYANIEILIVDNDSEQAETLAYFDVLKSDPRVRVLPYHGKFNYSAI